MSDEVKIPDERAKFLVGLGRWFLGELGHLASPPGSADVRQLRELADEIENQLVSDDVVWAVIVRRKFHGLYGLIESERTDSVWKSRADAAERMNSLEGSSDSRTIRRLDVS